MSSSKTIESGMVVKTTEAVILYEKPFTISSVAKKDDLIVLIEFMEDVKVFSGICKHMKVMHEGCIKHLIWREDLFAIKNRIEKVV